jgi:hypothetical protein
MLRLLALLLVLGFAASDAQAAGTFGIGPEERLGADPLRSVVTDGTRYAVWVGNGRLQVRDDWAGTAATVELGACETGWNVHGVGGGLALVACGSIDLLNAQPPYTPTVRPVARFVHLATGDQWDARYALTPLQTTVGPDGEFHYFFEIGTRWLAVHAASRGGGPTSYVDWRTGEVRDDPVTGSRKQTIDLDSPQLHVPLCAPLTRDVVELSAWTSLLRSGNAYVTIRGSFDEDRELVVRRCGSRRSVRIPLGRAGSSIAVSEGRVWWQTADELHTVTLARRARTTLRLPAGFQVRQMTRTAAYGVQYQAASAATRVAITRK